MTTNITIEASTVTTTGSQNINGVNDATGWFFRPNDIKYTQIAVGWTVVGNPTWIVTSVTCDTNDQYSSTITISGGVFTSGGSYAFTGKQGVTISNGITIT